MKIQKLSDFGSKYGYSIGKEKIVIDWSLARFVEGYEEFLAKNPRQRLKSVVIDVEILPGIEEKLGRPTKEMYISKSLRGVR